MTPQPPSPQESSAKAEATFFRPHDKLRIHHGHLPHWRQTQVTYFITTRLADSMPHEKLLQWQHNRDRWLVAHGLERPADIHRLTED